MEERGILSPVLSVEADYLRMVHFGDTVTIETHIQSYNGIKLTVAYEVIDDKTGIFSLPGDVQALFYQPGRKASVPEAGLSGDPQAVCRRTGNPGERILKHIKKGKREHENHIERRIGKRVWTEHGSHRCGQGFKRRPGQSGYLRQGGRRGERPAHRAGQGLRAGDPDL